MPDGRWAAFDIKLGQGSVDAAAASLTRFTDQVDTAKTGPPQALCVIVGTGMAYRRRDGIDVIPLGLLGP